MADKVSTLVLTVDFDCKKCCKKIRKNLCEFHEIERLTLDKKQKKVTISGRFNPECLIKRLYCKLGCNVIKGHEILMPPPPKPTPPATPAEDPKPTPPPKQTPPTPKPTPPKPSEPSKQPIHVGPVYVAPICICGRPCGGACTWRHSGWCWPYDYEICRRREGCCSPCRDGRPWDGICRRRDNCCSPCREGRPWDGICTNGGGQYGNSEDPTCTLM